MDIRDTLTDAIGRTPLIRLRKASELTGCNILGDIHLKQGRARDALLTQAIAAEEKLEVNEPQEDLLSLEGMTTELAYELASRGTCTQEDLAELSIDDLTDIEGIDEETAGKLIMTARAPWFEEAGQE